MSEEAQALWNLANTAVALGALAYVAALSAIVASMRHQLEELVDKSTPSFDEAETDPKIPVVATARRVGPIAPSIHDQPDDLEGTEVREIGGRHYRVRASE